MRRDVRRGYVLPFVIVALAASSVLALALTHSSWRAARATTLAARAETGALANAELLSRVPGQWRSDSLWRVPLLQPHARTALSAAGTAVQLTLWRTHPFVVWGRTTTVVGTARDHDSTRRDHLRVWWLAPPPVPLVATLTTLGHVVGSGSTLVSGLDVPLAISPCSLSRDTASVAPIAAVAVHDDSSSGWPGRPLWQPVAAALVRASALVAIDTMLTRSEQIARDSTPLPLPAFRPWHALSLRGPQVVVTGPTGWTGLLIVDGNLTVHGPLTIDGVVVVRGRLDVRAGTLFLRGAVLVESDHTEAVQLGNSSQLFYDRCAVQMALAAVSTPRSRPFFLWHALSP